MSSHFPSIALLLVVAAMPLIATAQEVAPADRAVHLRISGKPGQHFTPRRATVSRMVGRWVERLRDDVDCVTI